MFSEQIFTKVFEKSFNDEVDYTDRRGSLIYFKGEVYSMKYNFLNRSIAFFDRFKDRIGTVFYIVDLTYFSKLIHQPLLAIILYFSNMNSKST